MWNRSTVSLWTSGALPGHVTRSRWTVIVDRGFKRSCTWACVYVGYLRDLSTQYRSGTLSNTGWNAALNTHTHVSCLAIWWCLLHHLNITHTWGGKSRSNVQQGKSFLKRSPESTFPPTLFFFFFKHSQGSERSSCHLLVIMRPLPMTLTSVWPSQIKGRLSWGHKQRPYPAGTDFSLQLCSVSCWDAFFLFFKQDTHIRSAFVSWSKYRVAL